MVGNDKQPLDLSQDEHMKAFKSSMEKWSKGMADNKDGKKYGYVDIEGLDLHAFGTPYVA